MTQSKSPDRTQLKTIIITGGSSGIGFETARLLLENPEIRIVLIGKEKEKLDEAERSLEAPGRVMSLVCDLKDGQDVKKTAERVIASQKHLYGLVNNAGIYPFDTVAKMTDESWEESMAVNLKAPLLLMQAFAPHFARHPQGGRIVNVSSTAGILPNHFALSYSVSKAALIQLTRTAAKELGKDGITVNCVCPGIVKSPLHESYHASSKDLAEFYARRGSAFPMGRVGEPRDVASAIRYCLSEEASWMTGDVFVVDGGRLLL